VPAISSAAAQPSRSTSPPGLERALNEELARPIQEVQKQGPDGLRAHVQRLTELFASLDLSTEVSPQARRALSDHVLGRVAQATLLLRADQSVAPRRDGEPSTAPWWAAVLGPASGLFAENSGLLLAALGGLVIAFALGNVAGYRRGTRHASYYGGGESDPRMWLAARQPDSGDGAMSGTRVTLTQVRENLLAGRTVMLQLGYEIAPEHRGRYVELIRGMQQALAKLDGQSFAVWEDPRHANRFYEALTCHRPSTLDRLTRNPGELAALAAGIEACRAPGRPVLRRAWLGVLPEAKHSAGRPLPGTSSGHEA
jgi:hypothetical protein